MRQSIHHHYDQLTPKERAFVDVTFDRALYQNAQVYEVPLAGDDRVERAVDALARAVIESRPKVLRGATLIEPRPAEAYADPPMDGVMETHLALKGAGLL